MTSLRERDELNRLLGAMPRSRRQINGLFEADAEILKTGAGYIVSSIDSIGEEISQGLYRDPFLWGWLTVMSSVSDLAASGAEARGLLLSMQWAYGSSGRLHREVYRGVRAALSATSTPLIGGDSGGAKDHVLTSTILGESRRRHLTRLGIRRGDRVLLRGRAATGAGPALALRFLKKAPLSVFPEKHFRPLPEWKPMTRYRPHLVAAMDTSDGIAATVQTLGVLNGVGFRLRWEPLTLMPAARRAMERLGLAEPLLWMSDLGDLQTLAIARPRQAEKLVRTGDFLDLGEAVDAREGFSITIGGSEREFPAHWVTRGGRDLPGLERLYERLQRHFR